MEDMRGIFKNHNKSYMMVMVLSYLSLHRDYPRGVLIQELARRFQNTLAEREKQGLPVDVPPSAVGESWTSASASAVQSLLLGNPLAALKDVLVFDKGSNLLSVRPQFREICSEDWITELQKAASDILEEYWEALEQRQSDQKASGDVDVRSRILRIMDGYVDAKNETFKGHLMHGEMRDAAQAIGSLGFIPASVIVRGSVGQGNWANVPWIALMDTRNTSSTRDGVYVCYLFSEDMSHCYLTIARGVTRTIEEQGRRQAYHTFHDDNTKDRSNFRFDGMQTDVGVHLSSSGLGRDYEVSVIAYIKYVHEEFPSNEELISDLKRVMQNYQQYINAKLHVDQGGEAGAESATTLSEPTPTNVNAFITQTESYITSQGFFYSRELLAKLLISLKVRPFVILAGISGTGKSKIAALVARAFGATADNEHFLMIPVRPDWSDPSELLGYRDLNGDFIAGPLTQFVERAALDPDNPHFIVIDEMNLARVEYYLSDVLSVIETQRWEGGTILSNPLLQTSGMNERDYERYSKVTWPSNVMLIGTVNMDETTHSISKKVLDRATTIEFNEVELSFGLHLDDTLSELPSQVVRGVLSPDYLVLRDIPEDERTSLEPVIANLTEVNQILQEIGAQVGYRVRDVICFFVTYSRRFELFSPDEAFDIQLLQKVLPRIQGSSGTLRRVLLKMLRFCVGKTIPDDPDAYRTWLPGNSSDARFSRSAAKTADMLRRLDEDGFTSYWVS